MSDLGVEKDAVKTVLAEAESHGWVEINGRSGLLVHNADDSLHLPNLGGAEPEPSAEIRKRFQFSLCRRTQGLRGWTFS